jgi:signal transduction histidine kinase
MLTPGRTVQASPEGLPFSSQDHIVQFYDEEEFLHDAVAQFIASGVKSGEPVIVIATEPHRRAFSERLQANGLQPGPGQLALVDARETLSAITVDGAPDWELFRTRIGGLIDEKRAQSRGGRVRAFGEMVDLLWRDGNPQAAIRLEEMWNELGRLQQFSLLCAYVMGNFYKEADGAHFEQVCRVHAHVVPTEEYPQDGDPGDRLREVSRLQQRARALESEVQHRKQLENALREGLAERRRANEELARAVRFSEMFVGILGHDLRNPLSGILTAASLLARRSDSEKVVKPATRIVNSAERMGRMIDQILDFTRLRLGKGIPLERRRIDLAEVCRLVIDEIDGADEAKRMQLDVVGDALGLWDGDRLSQMVSNLIGNALSHGRQAAPVSIRLDGREAQRIQLEIHNDGAIPADVLPLIFEPFRNGTDRKEARSSGLGLGLFISQQIVLAHSGTIQVASSEHDGTRFVVRLPRHTPGCVPAFEPATKAHSK